MIDYLKTSGLFNRYWPRLAIAGSLLLILPPQQNLWVHFGSGRFPIT